MDLERDSQCGLTSPAENSNPFATRFIKPGALPFLFAADASPQTLLHKLAQNKWWGQIIGPHGVGKSSLLAALLPSLEALGKKPYVFTIAPDRPHPTWTKDSILGWDENSLIVVDGYEQLSWWSAMRLKRLVQGRTAGLLITAHQSMGLPPLAELSPSIEVAKQVVMKLLPPGDHTITADDVQTVFVKKQGNIRETLFELFDLYQIRSRILP